MSDDLPIPSQDGRPSQGSRPSQASRSEQVATVEWGADESPGRGRAGRFFEGLRRDPRTPWLPAGLGALAVFGAMTEDWVVMTLPRSGREGGPVSLPRGLAEFGSLGTGYLLGTLALAGCLALALSGSTGVRHNARMVGLALAGGTAGVLLAITATTDHVSRPLFIDPGEELDYANGRGLAMAYVATVAFAAALLLAAASPHPESGTGSGADAAPAPPWHRPRPDPIEPDDGSLPPPADLTVAPAPPFARLDSPFTRPEPPAGPDRSSWPDRGGHRW